MQKILRKRVWREFKENKYHYLALGLLILLGMYLIVSLVGAAETIITGVDEKAAENQIEDGEFFVFVPLKETESNSLEQKGITLEPMFYQDFEQKDGSILRLFQNRKHLNLTAIEEGRQAETEAEIVLEKRYCQEKGISVGDEITVGEDSFRVTGIGSAPDYDAVYRNLSDSSADSQKFGIAFVGEQVYDRLKKENAGIKSEEYVYAYRLNEKITHEELKEKIKKESVNNLTQFLKAEDNPRIKASANDQNISKMAGLIVGLIAMLLFTFVISVTVIHGIERESSIIGALYALGVKKKNLMVHYLTLPVLITFLSGIAGTALGFSKWGVNIQMQNCYGYFSLPQLQTIYSPYLIVYGIVMPPVIAAIVNCLVIYSRLSKPPLKLIRNEQKSNKVYAVNLGETGFIRRFQIRQMMREARTGFTVLFGMFISLLIMILGIDCYVMCRHIITENKADTKYQYMYTYKHPESTVAKGGEACYAKKLKKEIYGYNLDVTLLGIDEDNPYFNVKMKKGKKQIVISSAMAQKYDLSVGEKVILSDEEEEVDYVFQIEGITQYSVGLYAFMEIDSMRELFGQEKQYYNVVFSDYKLNISSDRLYATTSREEIENGSEVFISMMRPLVSILLGVSALIFCMVMYLMMKVMIDRSALSISLLKIFGYRTGEIRKLYLNGNFYTIAAGAAICIPLAKRLIDEIYPILVSNVAGSMNLTFSWQLYLGIYAAVLGMYFIINQLLVCRLGKLMPAEILKNRE